jgi:hypothetical protein
MRIVELLNYDDRITVTVHFTHCVCLNALSP